MSQNTTASYQFDLDPRYGWVAVMSDEPKIMFVIQTPDGAFGYTFNNGEFTPCCVCHAYEPGECCCQTGDWSGYTDWDE
jgi:hypothetical protein